MDRILNLLEGVHWLLMLVGLGCMSLWLLSGLLFGLAAFFLWKADRWYTPSVWTWLEQPPPYNRRLTREQQRQQRLFIQGRRFALSRDFAPIGYLQIHRGKYAFTVYPAFLSADGHVLLLTDARYRQLRIDFYTCFADGAVLHTTLGPVPVEMQTDRLLVHEETTPELAIYFHLAALDTWRQQKGTPLPFSPADPQQFIERVSAKEVFKPYFQKMTRMIGYWFPLYVLGVAGVVAVAVEAVRTGTILEPSLPLLVIISTFSVTLLGDRMHYTLQQDSNWESSRRHY